ncbi:hypothetical protein RhiirC2_799628 [Rhizophagus irregularis]|uniref:Reverse transcriptase n=1 Tax=Rhizophagus irregularis TaxID=588596 RepID=A0A2N1M4P3_9GLOM|nr:hypothetical protein RhiirC2_799628 [Rhizophagus irregularis]
MNNDYTKYVIKKDIIEGQALKLTLLLKEKIHFTIITIYNFSNNSYKDEILELYTKLEEILTAEKKLKAKINVMIDINLIYHDKPLNTWNRSDKKSRIDYIWVTEDLKIDSQLWEIYAEKIGKLLGKEKDIIDNVEILINSINRIWNTIRDTLKKANNELLKRKIMSLNLTNYRECKKFIEKHYETITEICLKFAIDINGLLDKNIKKFKEIVKIAFKLVQVNFAEESKIYKEEKMKFYIQRRCEDLQDNKKRFLDSTLNRKRSKIVLDKIVIEKNSVKQLISDEELIENNSKSNIKECWYNEVIQPISESEWDHMIRQLANNKAPGISQISNEMLKHMRTSMKNVTLKLANLCLQVGDIPEEWRHALLYPILKTMDWKYSLTKTRPIILLKTLRKVLVKIVTKRLSKVIAKRNILKGGNHAGLPGGFTEAPLKIINTCIEDAKKNNKDIAKN